MSRATEGQTESKRESVTAKELTEDLIREGVSRNTILLILGTLKVPGNLYSMTADLRTGSEPGGEARLPISDVLLILGFTATLFFHTERHDSRLEYQEYLPNGGTVTMNREQAREESKALSRIEYRYLGKPIPPALDKVEGKPSEATTAWFQR